jgi:hypothetical protein
MIALATYLSPAPLTIARAREILGPEAEALTDDQVAAELQDARALAQAICTLVSTQAVEDVKSPKPAMEKTR